MAAFTWRLSACASVAVVGFAAGGCGGGGHAAKPNAHASPRPGWGARVEIAIRLPNAKPLVDFPIPLKLTRERVDTARIAADGHDLRFTDATGVDLPFELEHFDAHKTTWVWVRLPRVEPGRETHLVMYFDNAKAPYLASSEARTVWRADFAGVYHFDDPIDDSSPGQSPTSGTGMSPADGIVGPARYFAAKKVDLITSQTAALPADHTLCAWAATDQIGAGAVVLAGYQGFSITRNGADAHCGPATAANGFAIGAWRQVCCVVAGGTTTLYVDGVPSKPARGGATAAGKLLIGNRWIGVIDEVRVATVARDADWITADHTAMTGDVATFGRVVDQ